MRAFIVILVASGFLLASGKAPATQPTTTPAPVTPVVEFEQLVELGKGVAAIRYESDNPFVYADLSDGLYKTAKRLEGGRVEFLAQVMRVTDCEVFIEVIPAGKTRLVLMHAAAPVFGNLRTVTYSGVPSTDRLHMFSAPVGLRIGSEITLDVAKKLRRRDILAMRGTIASLPVWIDSVFAPDVVGLISDWSVVAVNPQPEE